MMKNSGSPKLVKSAIRTMELFAAFAEAKRPLSLAEVAEAMAAPKSSCHELIQTLVHLGYVLVIDGGKHYYPSRRLMDLGEQINRFNPIKERVENILKRLRDVTGETIFIGRLQGQQAVYTEVFEGIHAIRFTARAGDLKDLHVSSMGKALLAIMEHGERDRLISKLELTSFNDNSITEAAALIQSLQAGLEKGFFTSEGESLSDVMGVAVPVRIQGHQLAFGLAGPISRVKKNLPSYVKVLKEGREKLQRQ
ncbi:IclR family transcriptional regulator [Pseudomaricurvus sp.]|uniref:IclR family transcriptional regulator n=1 Tax=Pseudomaricurvus sp. TaxID=2004510 RepID=UPI003F6C8D9C